MTTIHFHDYGFASKAWMHAATMVAAKIGGMNNAHP